MTERISKAIIKVATITLLASIVIIIGILYGYFAELQITTQHDYLDTVAVGVEKDKLDYIKALDIEKYRITWIAEDGSVIYDSKADNKSMENHSQRAEFIEAMQRGFGDSKRDSKTMSERTIYSARRLSDNTVIRISSTQLTFLSLVLSMLQPFLIISIIAIVFAVFFSSRIAKKAVEPINRINLDEPLDNDIYPELTPLLRRINVQNKGIQNQIKRLEQKNNEITYITENVSDGILMLNDKGYIVTANKVAKELLKCKEDSYYLELFRDREYEKMMYVALKGENSRCKIKINDEIYSFSASSTDLGNGKFSVFLFIHNITDEEKSLELRRQFSANVSHELKTPLAAIMGASELISNGIVKDEDVKGFAENIYGEAARLLKLVQDIIKISRLDEQGESFEFETTDLSILANEVAEQLKEKANSKSISIKTELTPLFVNGAAAILHEIIYNLCDNAIIYNKEGGEVTIRVFSDKETDKTVLSVSDTGFGIPKEHLPHIFERFYRVDKSHSKETGGTGLGLSIVKNGAELHHAELKIESEVGTGTTISLTF